LRSVKATKSAGVAVGGLLGLNYSEFVDRRPYSGRLSHPKAAVERECPGQLPDTVPAPLRLIFLLNEDMSTIPITKRGAELLKEELHRLKAVERPAVINAIAEARAQGDLSENAEYDAAKEKQAFIEGRILEVESKLSTAQVIDPTQLDTDGRIVFGATVDLEDLESGRPVSYQIVGDDEADLDSGKISVSSPIARALIGKFEGDVATVLAPGGEREYEVITVRYV
jgi:transcription elongation factor GreA